MLDTLLVFADTILLGLIMLALVLGLSCMVMAFLSTKTGADGMKERIEYGFFGVAGLAFMGLMAYVLA